MFLDVILVDTYQTACAGANLKIFGLGGFEVNSVVYDCEELNKNVK